MNILLIGCGNIGRRHLEAILKINTFATSIDILEQVSESIELTKVVIKDDNNAHTTKFLNTLEDCRDHYDVIISATTADARLEVIENLSAQDVKAKVYILEKVVAQHAFDLESIQMHLHDEVYVNHWMTMSNWFNDLKQIVIQNKMRNFNVSGSNWGLMCNSLHWINLISNIRNTEVCSMEVMGELTWHESKRKNFYDASGHLKVNYIDGTTLEIIDDGDGFRDAKLLCFGTNNNQINLVFDEALAVKIFRDEEEDRYPPNYQSDMTTEIIKTIYASSKLRIPLLADCLKEHTIFLNCVGKHIYDNRLISNGRIQIT